MVSETEKNEVFRWMDETKAGSISAAQLKLALRSVGVVASDKELSAAVKAGPANLETFGKTAESFAAKRQVITNKDGQAALMVELKKSFERMDKRKKGVISTETLKEILMKDGEGLSEAEFSRLFVNSVIAKQVAHHHPEGVNFDNFVKMLFGRAVELHH